MGRTWQRCGYWNALESTNREICLGSDRQILAKSQTFDPNCAIVTTWIYIDSYKAQAGKKPNSGMTIPIFTYKLVLAHIYNLNIYCYSRINFVSWSKG